MNVLESVEQTLGAALGRRNAAWPPPRLSLALQGGGSFGAYTWGVLDRLLESDEITFDTVSGTSAGAVNAVLLADGLSAGGREGAREKLAHFWERLSRTAAFGPFGSTTHFAPGGAAGTFSLWARLLSPYQYNPLDMNPLRTLLSEEIDFERLKAAPQIGLLIAATRVADGRAHIFSNADISIDAVLASACLPLLHHAVTIDDVVYWDGGYSSNPPLLELVAASDAPDVLIVRITPMLAAETPTSSREILRRLDQITFNASLQTELETLERQIARSHKISGLLSSEHRKLRRLVLHDIAAEETFDGLADANATNLDWSFLTMLRDHGRDAASAWLDRKQADSPAPKIAATLAASYAP
jgi:NTE family protein